MNPHSSTLPSLASGRAPLPLRLLLAAYLAEFRQDLLGALRSVGFALPTLLVPLAVYLVFGVLMTSGEGEPSYGPEVGNYLFVGFSALAVMMPGIFSSAVLAQEREQRLLLLKRALPLPPGASVLAKLLMAVTISTMAVSIVTLAALLLGKLTLSTAQILVIWLTMIVGSLPFAAIGLWIGSWSSAAAAPAWANLLFLPMLWLSGLFIPLPAFLKPWVVIWPAFHLNQLALGLAQVDGFIFIPTELAAVVLLAIMAICGVLAVRRLARVG